MKKLLAAICAAAMIVSLTACGAPEKHKLSLFAMDTYMTLVAYGDGADEALTASARAINELEQQLSRTREDSDVWRINHGGGKVDSVTVSLIAQALRFSDETGGAFDITVAPLVDLWAINSDSPHVPSQAEIDALLPFVGSEHVSFGVRKGAASSYDAVFADEGCAIDLGGIAKGYASDRVKEIFAEYGVKSGTVSLGGNVYVCGRRPDGKLWNVAVQNPEGNGYACMLTLSDTFAVTSGGYQRFFTAEDGTVYQHIIDPATGAPARSDLLSVTVVCPDGTRADAYSTALYVMGEDGAIRFWETQQSDPFEMVLITADGRIVCTPGLSDHIINQEDASYEVQFLPR
ncbi:MAG: FAD:protein FMN transferase [Oscillospiraceae bacterium]|nr:FAD:protein FMN transferase [Oscillospiraceae bacterium]